MSSKPIHQEKTEYISSKFHLYFETLKRFYETKDACLYVIKGWGFGQDGVAGKLSFEFDGEIVDVVEEYHSRSDIRKIFAEKNISGDVGFSVYVRTKKEDENKKFTISYESASGEKEMVAEVTAMQTLPTFLFNVDEEFELEDGKLLIRGWKIANPDASSAAKQNETVDLQLKDSAGNDIPFEREDVIRKDVIKQYGIEDLTLKCGFVLRWKYKEDEVYTLKTGEGENSVQKIFDIRLLQGLNREKDRRFLTRFSMWKCPDPLLKEDDKYYRETLGRSAYNEIVKKRLTPIDPEYQKYFDTHKASKAELRRQAAEKIDGPTFSIVVPTYNTRPDFLRDMIESCRAQSYPKWQLCIADGSEGNKELEASLEEYHKKDPRIVYTICDKNGGISINTNAALKLVTGDYIALLDHDDMLAPEALYEVVKVILANEDADVVYSDEDKFTDDVKDHYQPAFKPDFNKDFLRSCNYITHLFVVRKEIVDIIGEFDPNCDGSQDLDFILRCTEQARNVYHIPKILYYWRCHPGSVALNPGSKTYAYDAAKRAIVGQLTREGVAFDSVKDIPNSLGIYRVNYTLEKKKVSVVIIQKEGTKNTIEDSIRNNASYDNYEILYTENASAKACNEAVKKATGDYLLFVDSDMEVRSADAIEKLLATCERNDVGVAGGKVYYKDDTIYHIGVVLGYHELAGRLLAGRHVTEFGKYANAVLQQNVSAVLSCGMMVEKALFEKVGGFDPAFLGAFYDIDFCLRVQKEGYRISLDPEAEWTTNLEKYPECDIVDVPYKGYDTDVSYMKEKWSDAIAKGDPFYNPNLSMKRLSYDMPYDFI